MLTATGIEKAFGGVSALNGFEMTLESGDLAGLIGPNGAGKTTALNVITGLLRPDNGKITYNNRDITRMSPEDRARLGLSRTFQNVRLFEDLTVLQNVMAGAHAAHGSSFVPAVLGLPSHRNAERRIAELATAMLEITGMVEFARQRADSLSYGDRRRVEIARALACEPQLLLLDEPAAGMNEREKSVLSELILSLNCDRGLTIVLVEHNVPMVSRLCRKLVVLNKGETIVSGSVAEALRDPDVVEIYLGKRHIGNRNIGRTQASL